MKRANTFHFSDIACVISTDHELLDSGASVIQPTSRHIILRHCLLYTQTGLQKNSRLVRDIT
jgi:hypothetical protein